MHIAELYSNFQQYPFISTDTRKITPDSIFFALKGANFNGNSFAKQALESGARFVVIDEADYFENNGQYILVDNVLKTLQDLAAFHRKQLSIPVIGITGTNGKTTTKELLNAVLSQKFETFATQGNLNNHIGVPLTLLAINSEVEAAIIEMGANHVGEIAFLCEIAQPNYGLITNVGKAHLEGFGSFEGVKKAKGELYDYLSVSQSTVFLQADNGFLKEMLGTRSPKEVITYGFSEDLDIQGHLEKANPYLSVSWKLKQDVSDYFVSTKLTGSYNTENILAAVAVGIQLGLNPAEINKGISSYTPQNNRSQITKTVDNTIIADFYNANSSSMEASLDNMKVIEAEKKVIILGDMFEMGDESFNEHQKVITRALNVQADRVFFVGKAFYEQKDERALFFETTEHVKKYLQDKPLKNATILLKASRGMAFEQLIEVL